MHIEEMDMEVEWNEEMERIWFYQTKVGEIGIGEKFGAIVRVTFGRDMGGLPEEFDMTETPLLSMALGVIAKDAARMASLKPGTCRSAISSVASGVQSLGEKPVPPVVRIKSAVPLSQISFMVSESSCRSSGKIRISTTV